MMAAAERFWIRLANTLWSPVRALDTGSCLSYLAAGGILVMLRLVGRPQGKGWRMLTAAAAVSIAAQWSTLPVVAAAFGRLNPWATLANVVAVPIFGAAVWLTSAALVVEGIWPAAGRELARQALRVEACALAIEQREAEGLFAHGDRPLPGSALRTLRADVPLRARRAREGVLGMAKQLGLGKTFRERSAVDRNEVPGCT